MPRPQTVERGPGADAVAAVTALRKIVRALRLSAAEVTRVTGTTTAQLLVLRTIADHPGSSIGDVARATWTDLSSASVLVRRLVDRGLVRRRPAPGDARRVRLDATVAGRALLRGAPSAAQERLSAALAAMSPSGVRRLARSLEGLVSAMGVEGERAALFFEDEPGPRAPRRGSGPAAPRRGSGPAAPRWVRS